MRKLLLASNNRGKIKEFYSLLRDIPYKLTTLAEEGIGIKFDESGQTFEENARNKALFYMRRSGLLTMADDSGLEVDALDGRPGVMSARYAGENASDADNIKKLLSELKNVPHQGRTARFRCVIAIIGTSGKIETCQGECSGVIIFESRGNMGFGYDPVFYIPELNKTMAELTVDEKNEISHRARAVKIARLMLGKIQGLNNERSL